MAPTVIFTRGGGKSRTRFFTASASLQRANYLHTRAPSTHRRPRGFTGYARAFKELLSLSRPFVAFLASRRTPLTNVTLFIANLKGCIVCSKSTNEYNNYVRFFHVPILTMSLFNNLLLCRTKLCHL